ncbi:protein transport protein SEC20, putative [Plasmodium gallinaceum]|uniref:Protein transport protein SEC20, putative n=1 Tax=Plasmodium gallinaceum TaxID=5849 RepID=A0A1J1H2J4_PLAGA|nr:protein transport protein SEC20, putative [Plasmodium gallinaceum]CRG97558.1 protein transport protein SEC20, putative [Plasmodium gallinaceum]
MNENIVSNFVKKNKNVDNFNKINTLINQMKLVDDNLKNLFLSEEGLNDHDSFLLFRSKVSRRIIDYSNTISQFNKIICLENIEKNVKEEYEYHLKNIENYKKKLSLWWNTWEKDYHRLCMKLFLKKKISNNYIENNEEKNKDMYNINLKDTRKMMIDEVNRMKNVKSELLDSSQKLKKQDEIFNSFEMKLKSSAQLIFSLKKKAENDTRYVWYSFFFFLSVCIYIILRRLGFIRAIIAIIKFIISILFYIGGTSFKLYTFIKKITSKNQIESEDLLINIGNDSITTNEL